MDANDAGPFGQRIKNQYYDDTISFMKGNLKRLMQEGQVLLPDDRNHISQLSCRTYMMTENSRVRVKSKQKMKARGLSSPDEADCLLMLCVPFNRERAKEERMTA